jgi:hypothetical protein
VGGEGWAGLEAEGTDCMSHYCDESTAITLGLNNMKLRNIKKDLSERVFLRIFIYFSNTIHLTYQ